MANSNYIDIIVPSDTATLTQTALTNIASAMPGWRPREGNLDVLLIEQFAELAQESATVAAQVPLSIFSYYGSLLGITQNSGVPMVISTTWTLTAPTVSDFTIPQGTVASIIISSVYYQFKTNLPITISTGNSSISGVSMTAISSGASYNSVTAGVSLQPLYYLANLSKIQIDLISTAGSDSETTSNYLNRLANTLGTYAPRPILPNDYAAMAATVSGVGRATALDNVNSSANVLSTTVSNPSTSGWFAANGTTVAASTNPVGVSVVSTSLTSKTFLSSLGTAIPAGSNFMPFTTTTASGVTSTSTSITVASVTNFTAGGGFGFIANSTNQIVGFSYTGYSGTTLNGVVFNTQNNTTYPATAYVSPVGATAFWTSTVVMGTNNLVTSNPCTLTSTSMVGMPFSFYNGTLTEPIVTSGVIYNSSGSTPLIGFAIGDLNNAYNTTNGVTFGLYPGATTGAISTSSNCTNLIANVTVKSSSTSSSYAPFLSATVTYKDQTTPYIYNADVSLNSGVYSTYPQNLYTAIKGWSPQTLTASGITPADPLMSTYTPNVETVTLNVWWLTKNVVTNYITLASLYESVDNTSYYLADNWITSSNNNPGSILPDGLFQSVYPNLASTVYSGSTQTVTSANSATQLQLNSVYNWPTAGVGTFIDSTNVTHYFTYTGITGTTLTGVAISPTGSGNIVFNATTVTCLTQTNNALQWTFGNSRAGSLLPLPSVGIQYTPNGTIITESITSASSAAGTSTYNVASGTNTIAVGDYVTTTGFATTSYNVTNQLVTASTTSSFGVLTTTQTGTATTGTAVTVGGLATSVYSSIFPLSDSTTYVLDGIIDASSTTSGAPTLTVIDASTNLPLSGYSTPTFTISGISATKQRQNDVYASTAYKDVYLQIYYPGGMATNVGGSVTISNLQIIPLVGNLSGVTTNYSAAIDKMGNPGINPGPYWTPGGTYNTTATKNITVIVSDQYGLKLDFATAQTVQNYLNSYRELNFVCNVIGPAYVLIDISYTAYAAKGYDVTTVTSAINSAITNWISPAYWASTTVNGVNWDSSQTTIRYLDLAGIIDDVDGVAGIDAVGLCLHGGTPIPADLVLSTSRLAPLPIVAKITPTVVPVISNVFEVS